MPILLPNQQCQRLKALKDGNQKYASTMRSLIPVGYGSRYFVGYAVMSQCCMSLMQFVRVVIIAFIISLKAMQCLNYPILIHNRELWPAFGLSDFGKKLLQIINNWIAQPEPDPVPSIISMSDSLLCGGTSSADSLLFVGSAACIFLRYSHKTITAMAVATAAVQTRAVAMTMTSTVQTFSISTDHTHAHMHTHADNPEWHGVTETIIALITKVQCPFQVQVTNHRWTAQAIPISYEKMVKNASLQVVFNEKLQCWTTSSTEQALWQLIRVAHFQWTLRSTGIMQNHQCQRSA